MELPKWAYKADSIVRSDGGIDMRFSLHLLGRSWLVWCAFVDLIRTSTITITIAFQEGNGRPIVMHDGERIEPSLDYTLEEQEIEDLVLRIPVEKLNYLKHLIAAREKIRPEQS